MVVVGGGDGSGATMSVFVMTRRFALSLGRTVHPQTPAGVLHRLMVRVGSASTQLVDGSSCSWSGGWSGQYRPSAEQGGFSGVRARISLERMHPHGQYVVLHGWRRRWHASLRRAASCTCCARTR